MFSVNISVDLNGGIQAGFHMKYSILTGPNQPVHLKLVGTLSNTQVVQAAFRIQRKLKRIHHLPVKVISHLSESADAGSLKI